jgi:hypothetical protein
MPETSMTETVVSSPSELEQDGLSEVDLVVGEVDAEVDALDAELAELDEAVAEMSGTVAP